MKMNRTALVAKVAETTGKQKKDAQVAVDAIFNVIWSELVNGGKIHINKFGTFEVKTRAVRKGVHPRTGEIFTTAPLKVPVFIAGRYLKAKVDN